MLYVMLRNQDIQMVRLLTAEGVTLTQSDFDMTAVDANVKKNRNLFPYF